MHLLPVQYSYRNYPPGITPHIQEVSGHFDTTSINPSMPYTLHTEYSYGPRKLNSPLLNNLPTVRNAHKNYVPRLWLGDDWAKEFAEYVVLLVDSNQSPSAIEIHPPFKDYCPTIEDFLDIYTGFEKIILNKFPNTKVFLENRCGSTYPGGRFLVSTTDNLLQLCKAIEQRGLKLRLVLDVIQLFTAHTKSGLTETLIRDTLSAVRPCTALVEGLHLWGKRTNAKGRLVSHVGDLDSYFNYNKALKGIFLGELAGLLSDGKTRYFVPEVNSNDKDLHSIVADLLAAGFQFV